MRELKEYEIWVGNYHLGQGYDPPTAPQLVSKVKAYSFEIACLKYELFGMLQSISSAEANGQYIDKQSCRWWYDFDTNANSWTGKYFETNEEAQKTFRPRIITEL